MVRRGERVRIAFAAIAAVDLRDQGVDDLVDGVVFDDRVLIVGGVNGDGDGVSFLHRAGEFDIAHRENFAAGGISHSRIRDVAFGRRIHHHPDIESVGHIQVRPVPRQ